MIDQKQVKHIAQLARLGLSASETKKMQKELASILDYIGLLNQVDTKNVDIQAGFDTLQNITREDKVDSENSKTKQTMLDQAPQTDEGFVAVKKIL